ncbi:MAG: WbqC family protein [Candidatus Omnitrophota bacterium]
MILSVHQPQYLPWLGYFDKILNSDGFVFLDTVQYKHREYQNRNKIRTKDGWIWLTVPVITKGCGRQKISEVCIDNCINWQKKHWQSLKSCYGHTPFFKQYCGFFENIYSVKWEKLITLNVHITKFIIQEFGIKTQVHFESELGIAAAKTERIIEICRKLKADTYLSGIGGKDYLEEEKLEQAGIELRYQDFVHPVYPQQHMKDPGDFLPYMSVVDLLFNEGNGSILKNAE